MIDFKPLLIFSYAINHQEGHWLPDGQRGDMYCFSNVQLLASGAHDDSSHFSRVRIVYRSIDRMRQESGCSCPLTTEPGVYHATGTTWTGMLAGRLSDGGQNVTFSTGALRRFLPSLRAFLSARRRRHVDDDRDRKASSFCPRESGR